jgi:hypothetical protein
MEARDRASISVLTEYVLHSIFSKKMLLVMCFDKKNSKNVKHGKTPLQWKHILQFPYNIIIKQKML